MATSLKQVKARAYLKGYHLGFEDGKKAGYRMAQDAALAAQKAQAAEQRTTDWKAHCERTRYRAQAVFELAAAVKLLAEA